LSKEGMPLGVQVMSKALTDNSLLDFSELLENELAFQDLPFAWSS
jgi:Asp-tRNA(Asn)/Glu-tRNA(Gln) amidotransferase A subunit family amidase